MYKFFNLHNQKDDGILRFVANLAFIIQLCILASKSLGYLFSDSLAIKSSLVDSFFDVITAIMVIFSVKISQKPPNKNYQFGYGKIDGLSSFVQAVFIAISGVILLVDAFENFMNPEPLKNLSFAIYSIVTTSVFLIILTTVQKYTIKRTGSLIIEASYIHFKLDFLLNLGLLTVLILDSFLHTSFLDGTFATCFNIYLFHNAIRIVRKSLVVLLDKAIPEHNVQKINNILTKYKEIKKIDFIKTRITGTSKIIQIKFQMPPETHLFEIRTLKQSIESDINRIYKNSLVIIEIDPLSNSSKEKQNNCYEESTGNEKIINL